MKTAKNLRTAPAERSDHRTAQRSVAARAALVFARAPLAIAAAAALAACGEGAESSTGGSTTTEPTPCGAAAVDGVAVARNDVYGGTPYALGYPPYAIDGCLLAYVTEPEAGETAGALVLRDLSNGEETILAPPSERPRRPALAGGVLAWEGEEAGVRVVRVHAGGATVTVKGPFDHAGEPRVAEDAVVLTAFLEAEDTGDTDVYLVVPGEAQAEPIATGPGQQRFADVSDTHVAFADFVEDPDGRFDQNSTDLADVVIHDRETGLSSVRLSPGKQAFPLLGAKGKIAYLRWGPDHPEPKFSAYELFVGDIDAPAGADEIAAAIETWSPYIRPAAYEDRLAWVQWPGGEDASLWQRPADLSAPPEALPGLAAPALFGPAAAERLTVVVSQEAGGQMVLRAAEQ